MRGDELSSREPFFREYSPTGSGHPSGFTYGWVSNDEEYLHVRIDFTPDNTMDGEKDYAKVYVKTGEGLKEFKVSVPERRWGKPDFTYTDKVSYQHKIYDFKIPLKELGVEEGEEELLMAFAAYGTATPNEVEPEIAYDPQNNRYLVVYQKDDSGDQDIKGQLTNFDGTTIGGEILISLQPINSSFSPQ